MSSSTANTSSDDTTTTMAALDSLPTEMIIDIFVATGANPTSELVSSPDFRKFDKKSGKKDPDYSADLHALAKSSKRLHNVFHAHKHAIFSRVVKRIIASWPDLGIWETDPNDKTTTPRWVPRRPGDPIWSLWKTDFEDRARSPGWICTGVYPRVVTYELVIKLAFVLHGIKGESRRRSLYYESHVPGTPWTFPSYYQALRDLLIKAEQTEVSGILRPSMYGTILHWMRDEGFKDLVKCACLPFVTAPDGTNLLTRPGAILDELSNDDPPDIVLNGSPLMKYWWNAYAYWFYWMSSATTVKKHYYPPDLAEYGCKDYCKSNMEHHSILPPALLVICVAN